MSDSVDDLELTECDGNSENELYEHFRFVADKGQQLLRVDKFLVSRLEKSSRNRVQQAADALGALLAHRDHRVGEFLLDLKRFVAHVAVVGPRGSPACGGRSRAR